MPRSASRAAVVACARTGTPKRRLSTAAPATWSSWWCESQMARSSPPRRRHSASTMPPRRFCSSSHGEPGSTTTRSRPPSRRAFVCVAGGNVRTAKGMTRIAGRNSIGRGASGSRASERRSSRAPRSAPWSARIRSVASVGCARNASPRSQQSNASLARIHWPESNSPGTTRGWRASLSGQRSRKNVASNRIGDSGGVTHRPANRSRAKSRTRSWRRSQAPKSSASSSSRLRAWSKAAGAGSWPRTARTPVSSNSSRKAQAGWAAAGPDAR